MSVPLDQSDRKVNEMTGRLRGQRGLGGRASLCSDPRPRLRGAL